MSSISPARSLQALALTVAMVTGGIAAASPASAVSTPPTPGGQPSGVEDLVRYVGANSCDPAVKPGAKALGDLLVRTYPGTRYGLQRPCGSNTLPTSEHYDGRGIDWMTNSRDATQRAQAEATIAWLMATDAKGNAFANARRTGVMYLIWNNKKWSAWDPSRWTEYRTCLSTPDKSLDSYCHRNHIHFSLSWAGAMGRTSYWSKSVAPMDWGPCRTADLNWASPYTKPQSNRCPTYPTVSAPSGASSVDQMLVKFSGVWLSVGSQGPVVTALQSKLGIGSDGVFGAQTQSAVKAFQAAHGVRVTGNLDADTWRAVLRAGTVSVPTPPPPTPGKYAAYENIRLSYGARGTTVKVLQGALNMRTSDRDGIFGAQTKAAVIAFQKQAKLTSDGIVTKPVWQALGKITPAAPPTAGKYAAYENTRLAFGSRGTTVTVLQRALGMSAHDSDGVFGAHTKAVVIAYQKRVKLTANGIVTKPVWQALGR